MLKTWANALQYIWTWSASYRGTSLKWGLVYITYLRLSSNRRNYEERTLLAAVSLKGINNHCRGHKSSIGAFLYILITPHSTDRDKFCHLCHTGILAAILMVIITSPAVAFAGSIRPVSPPWSLSCDRNAACDADKHAAIFLLTNPIRLDQINSRRGWFNIPRAGLPCLYAGDLPSEGRLHFFTVGRLPEAGGNNNGRENHGRT